jgi:hypothetical protein
LHFPCPQLVVADARRKKFCSSSSRKRKEKALWIVCTRSFVFSFVPFSFKKLGTGYYTHGLCKNHSQKEKEVRVLRAMQSPGHARCGRASSFSSALSKNSGKTYFDANIEITVLPVIEQILHLIKA